MPEIGKNTGTGAIQRILGVDTALRVTGYGVIDTDGRRFATLDCGVIKTSKNEALSECLRRIGGGIREIVKQYSPQAAAIEGAFFCKNVKTAMVLGMARGVVVGALAELGVPIYEYAPRRVKQAVCGYGHAGKEQVALIVSKMLNIDVANLPDDASDALGLAICHIQTQVSMQGLYLPDRL